MFVESPATTGSPVALVNPSGQYTVGELVTVAYLFPDQLARRMPELAVASLVTGVPVPCASLVKRSKEDGSTEFYLAMSLNIHVDGGNRRGDVFENLEVFGVMDIEMIEEYSPSTEESVDEILARFEAELDYAGEVDNSTEDFNPDNN